MQYRKLGHSGIDIPVVGFGAWAIGGWMWGGADQQEAIAAIHAAVDQGMNLLDTAPMYGYGRSEEIVGQAIRGRRDRVVLATKCGLVWDREEGEFHFQADEKGMSSGPGSKKVYKNLRPESIRAELEGSLRRLGTDHVDLYQTHWQTTTTPIADTMAALVALKEQGKIRAIGVSNASLAQLKAYGPIDSDQERFHMLERKIQENRVLEHCRRQNIAMLAYSPLAHGLLTGKIRPDREFGEGDLRRTHPHFQPEGIRRVNAKLAELQPIADRHQVSIGQLVIAWTFSQPGLTCVLCGARSPQQALENARAGEIQLLPEEIELIGTTVR
jgi:methylglyoxal reductase